MLFCVLLKGDWMERLLYSVLNCSVLWKSMGPMNNKRGGLILYTVRKKKVHSVYCALGLLIPPKPSGWCRTYIGK